MMFCEIEMINFSHSFGDGRCSSVAGIVLR